jgi:hypothetical protein
MCVYIYIYIYICMYVQGSFDKPIALLIGKNQAKNEDKIV